MSDHDAPFRAGEDGAAVLRGHRCTRCGHVAFPAQPYGCESCGSAEPAEEADLPATGVVRAAATVRRHHDARVAVPFTIVSVLLDAGPLVRGRGEDVRAGDRVGARIAEPDDPGSGAPELVFTPAHAVAPAAAPAGGPA